MATPERLQKNSEKNDDLEKATKYLLESLMDILTAGGPAFSPALNELKALLTSSPLLEAENFKRRAYNLAKTAGDLASAAKGSVEVKDGAPPPAGGVKAKDGFRGGAPEIRKGAPQAPLAKICAAMVGHVVSIRPNHYEAESKTLLNMITAGRPLDEILRALLELVKRLRDDLLEERSKAFKHIGDVLKALEETENDFVSSLEASRSYLSDSDAGFAAAMEDGLRELGEMANPATADMELLCRRLSEKVAHLHSCVQQKRRLDQARLDALTEARRQAERRLDKRRRDYEDFSRQSHAMLKEIENLRAVSLKDPLTDVYNRRAYDDQIIKTLAELRKEVLKTCSMIVFDIDLFRDFNNVYGHLAGDRVLAYVARLTQETLRADDLIFRYGGDEFVVLMPNAGLKAAAVVAEKIRRAINAVEFKLFKNSEVTVRLSMSMGVSEARLDDDPAGFFARADKAMYAAKAAGRNRVSVADD